MTTPPIPTGSPSPLPLEGLAEHLEQARWFGGKGRAYTVASVTRVGVVPIPLPEPRVVVDLVEVRYADGENETELYQLPLALYAHPQERLGHAFLSWHDEGAASVDTADSAPSARTADHPGDDGREAWMHAYDAVHDREAMAGWLAAFAATPAEGDAASPTHGATAPDGDALRFHRLPGHDLDVEAHSTPFSGEQSNSSVMFGDDSLLKVFRKVTPGVNPDVEIHDVLTRAGSDHVAALYGWLEGGSPEEPLQLALLQQFLKTASDGWELALTSVRNLFAEAAVEIDENLRAADAGGDFADEAGRLGEALAEVHADLAGHFGSRPLDAAELAALGARMGQRLDAALSVVPELAEHETALRATFAAVADVGAASTQRVHGDLHLGQTLRTVVGWKLVDFEGEPAKSLPERQRPDSPWRDVAGMLRSFDYAAQSVVMTAAIADVTQEVERPEQARAWSRRNRKAFLAGYLRGAEISADDDVLLRAYVADKAVYEAVYEARNRPGWLPIPLAALAASD